MQTLRVAPFLFELAFFVCPNGLKRDGDYFAVYLCNAFGIFEFFLVFLCKVLRQTLKVFRFDRCISDKELPENDVEHFTGVLFHIALFNLSTVLAAVFGRHISVQTHTRIASVKAGSIDGIAAHAGLKRLVV